MSSLPDQEPGYLLGVSGHMILENSSNSTNETNENMKHSYIYYRANNSEVHVGEVEFEATHDCVDIFEVLCHQTKTHLSVMITPNNLRNEIDAEMQNHKSYCEERYYVSKNKPENMRKTLLFIDWRS